MLTFKQFLHEQNTTERKSAMDKAIDRQIEKMRKNAFLKGSDPLIGATPASDMLASMRETTPTSVSSIVPSGNAMYGVQDVARNRETIIGTKQPSISLSASPSLGKYSSTYRL